MRNPERINASPAQAGFEAARAVADAVLYEGYLLYPYRRSAGKNRVRWQFGVLAPRSWVAGQASAPLGVSGSADGWFHQAECLLEATRTATVTVRLGFLQLTRRQVERGDGAGGFEPVDDLETGGARMLSFDEARPHEIDVTVPLADLLDGDTGAGSTVVEIPGGVDVEPVVTPPRAAPVRVRRQRWPATARITLSTERATAPFRLYRIRTRVENTALGVPADRPRAEALRHSLIAAHTLLGVSDGRFLSLLDPPAWASAAAGDCENLRVQPVLAGADETDDVVLCSPIILYDHPRTAPESPGDLFDATEIDEILSLRTRALTEAEKREARATDPRAAEIIDRADGLPAEILDRLHGAIRTLRPPSPHCPSVHAASASDPAASDPAGSDPAASDPAGFGSVAPVSAGDGEAGVSPAWWEPEADRSVRPGEDSVLVAGTAVSRGSQVRLRPRPRGTDAHDMFLVGRPARVEAVFRDVDGASHVAVTLEGAGDLHRAAGRYFYFAPDELEPLGCRPGVS